MCVCTHTHTHHLTLPPAALVWRFCSVHLRPRAHGTHRPSLSCLGASGGWQVLAGRSGRLPEARLLGRLVLGQKSRFVSLPQSRTTRVRWEQHLGALCCLVLAARVEKPCGPTQHIAASSLFVQVLVKGLRGPFVRSYPWERAQEGPWLCSPAPHAWTQAVWPPAPRCQ